MEPVCMQDWLTSRLICLIRWGMEAMEAHFFPQESSSARRNGV